MCKALKTSRSGYYRWLSRKPSQQEVKRNKITMTARKYHAESNSIYGYRKVLKDIQEHEPELACIPETIRLIMQKEHLFSCVKRKFKNLILGEESYYQHADNKLNRDFTATKHNEKWTADITFIRTYEGWLYLACVIDLFSRKVVGWSMSDTIISDLVYDAWSNALHTRSPKGKVMYHSDQGTQYKSSQFHKLLDKNNIICSMSTKGNPWDNACQKSFLGKLKSEWIRKRVYNSHAEARQDIFKYIELFYNRKRRHASLRYISPVEFKRRAASNAA